MTHGVFRAILALFQSILTNWLVLLPPEPGFSTQWGVSTCDTISTLWGDLPSVSLDTTASSFSVFFVDLFLFSSAGPFATHFFYLSDG